MKNNLFYFLLFIHLGCTSLILAENDNPEALPHEPEVSVKEQAEKEEKERKQKEEAERQRQQQLDSSHPDHQQEHKQRTPDVSASTTTGLSLREKMKKWFNDTREKVSKATSKATSNLMSALSNFRPVAKPKLEETTELKTQESSSSKTTPKQAPEPAKPKLSTEEQYKKDLKESVSTLAKSFPSHIENLTEMINIRKLLTGTSPEERFDFQQNSIDSKLETTITTKRNQLLKNLNDLLDASKLPEEDKEKINKTIKNEIDSTSSELIKEAIPHEQEEAFDIAHKIVTNPTVSPRERLNVSKTATNEVVFKRFNKLTETFKELLKRKDLNDTQRKTIQRAQDKLIEIVIKATQQ